MKQTTGEANITVIAIILIGIVIALGAVLVPKMTSNATYISCCNRAGGKWSAGYCSAITPTTCGERETMWKEYDSCVIESGKHNANEKYRAVDCTN